MDSGQRDHAILEGGLTYRLHAVCMARSNKNLTRDHALVSKEGRTMTKSERNGKGPTMAISK